MSDTKGHAQSLSANCKQHFDILQFCTCLDLQSLSAYEVIRSQQDSHDHLNAQMNNLQLDIVRLAEIPMGKLPSSWWACAEVMTCQCLRVQRCQILNFSAGFAAQSLLAALGSIQFVSNVFFASAVLGEKVRGLNLSQRWQYKYLVHPILVYTFQHAVQVTRRVLFATTCIVIGCVLLVSFGNHQSQTLTVSDMLSYYARQDSSCPYRRGEETLKARPWVVHCKEKIISQGNTYSGSLRTADNEGISELHSQEHKYLI